MMAADNEGTRYQGTIARLLRELQATAPEDQQVQIELDIAVSLRRIADALEHLAAIADVTSRVQKREE
jgi:hypothetical protein